MSDNEALAIKVFEYKDEITKPGKKELFDYNSIPFYVSTKGIDKAEFYY